MVKLIKRSCTNHPLDFQCYDSFVSSLLLNVGIAEDVSGLTKYHSVVLSEDATRHIKEQLSDSAEIFLTTKTLKLVDGLRREDRHYEVVEGKRTFFAIVDFNKFKVCVCDWGSQLRITPCVILKMVEGVPMVLESATHIVKINKNEIDVGSMDITDDNGNLTLSAYVPFLKYHVSAVEAKQAIINMMEK